MKSLFELLDYQIGESVEIHNLQVGECYNTYVTQEIRVITKIDENRIYVCYTDGKGRVCGTGHQTIGNEFTVQYAGIRVVTDEMIALVNEKFHL